MLPAPQPVQRARTLGYLLRLLRVPVWVLALAGCGITGQGLAAGPVAATGATRVFELPPDEAVAALRRFAAQSGLQLIYAGDAVRGVKTAQVRGVFTPREALERMLGPTGLAVTEDKTTGAFAITRSSPAVTVPPSATERSRPQTRHLAPESSPTTPMKKRNLIALISGWLAFAVPPAHAAAGDAGPSSASNRAASTVAGRVSNAATHANLEGAVVRVEAQGIAVTTERGGTFQLPLPAGNHTLTVSYTGLETETASVSVPAGQTVRRDFALTSDIYRLNPYTVTGEREGNALAITLQRESQGVRNIVSTDAFGALAGNPADLLVRLPGIEGTSTSGDTRYIRIRGMHQSLSTVTIDGNRASSANGAGTDRVMEFYPTGSDSIERIEVVKSPTPDMDGDSIGGAVNMVSKSAFDRSPERHVVASVGGIWRPLDRRRDPIHPSYMFSYSEVFGGKLGVAFNFASRLHGTPEDLTSAAYQTLANGVTGPRFNNNFQFENLEHYDRSGIGGGLKLDYKVSDTTRVHFNTKLDRYGEHAHTHGGVFSTTASLATVDAAGNPTGGGGIMPGYTDNVTVWRANSTNAAGQPVVAPSTLSVWMRTTERRNWLAQNTLGAEHKFDSLQIDWNLFQSRAKVQYPGNKRLDVRVTGFGIRIERDDEPFYPQITQTGGPDITRIENYNGTNNNTYAINLRKSAWDEYRGLSLNLRKEFSTVVPTYLKGGIRYRGQERDGVNNAYRGTYVGPDGVVGVNPLTGINDDNLAQFVHPLNDPELRTSKRLSRYPALPYPRRMALDEGGPGGYSNDETFNIDTAFQRNRNLFRDDIAFIVQQNLEGYTHFAEDITAAYIMGNIELGKLSVLGGLRVEETEVLGRGTGATITAEERARRAAWVGPVTDDELRRRTIAQYGTMGENRGKYRNVLPGVHFKYRPAQNLIARLSYATNIGRPDIGNLIARTTADDLSLRVTANNPALEPQTADNFDLSVEYYLRPAGMISAGVFLKELKNFIFTQAYGVIPSGPDNGFDGDYAGYTLTTKVNGGYAKIRGLELSFMQQFTFLPGWWSGWGAFANFTKLDAEGHYNAGNSIAPAATDKVAGFNPTGANLGLSYIRNKVTFRVQYNHRGRFLTTYNPTLSARTYSKARDVIDIKAGYQLSKRYDLYVNVDNVLNEADLANELHGGYASTFIKISPLFHFGINARY